MSDFVENENDNALGQASETASAPTRIRLLTAALLVGTFAAGTAFGAGLITAIAPRPPMGFANGPPRPPPPPPGPLPLGELDLSEAQREQARVIIEKHRPALEAILRESFPRMRAENEQIEKEIRAILTDEQQKKLDALHAARPPRPPPGGPPGLGPPPPPPPPPGAREKKNEGP